MPIKSRIRTIPHYPRQGIQFRDITTLLKDPVGFRIAIDELANRYAGQNIDKIAAIESRGFIIGAPLAYRLGVGLVPVRKPGKLPAKPSVTITRWNMGTTVSKSIPMQLPAARKCC